MQWNAALYQSNHAFVFQYGEGVVELLAPQRGERILDIGCGTAELTARIAEAGAEVVGLDSSPEMIAAARQRFPQLEFTVADAANFSFEKLFDAVFSNAALHWVKDAEGAVICMARSLKPGGRLVIEMGGRGNIAQLTDAIGAAVLAVTGITAEHGRHYPSISEYTGLLEKHGLEIDSAQLFARPTRLADGEAGLHNWIDQFEQAVLKDFSAEQRAAIIALAEERLREKLFIDGHWIADYKRLRIVAHKI
jgi:trans-aconitate 2-methyltransferase